ncbi:hypothetical protein [Ideonella sp. A 288]|uniref:hypothetical protein n=1 Tax=Ideonella sp. A 288 TaxID=1962181 RepID=UPI000B4BB426|nr:hypothetical protein [Ideonella sp. A 288]
MTVDALVVLQRSDVDHLAAHAERYADTPLLFVDPGILDAALQAGLKHYELRRLDVGRDISALAFAEAMTLAASIDLALTRERHALWGDGAFHGWDQTVLYLTLQRAFTMRLIGRAIERAFPEPRLGLLRPDNAALFNWDSMLSTEVVGADRERWQVVDRYASGRYWNPALFELCFDFDGVRARAEAGDAQALTHIPTCFYDAGRFEAAIAAAFERNIDLPGAYCDVPVRRGPGLLLQRLADAGGAAADASVAVYRERARQVLIDHLAPLVPSAHALARQVEVFAQRCHQQAANFLGLREALAGQRPYVVLADHDIGCNGPLFSLAAALEAPVTVLPHSAYPTTRMPHAQRVTVVERDGLAVPVCTVLGQPVAVRPVRFRGTVEVPPRPALRRVCLLLNTMLAEGLSYVELFALIGFHKALSALCERHDRDLVVRLKPSTPALSVVASALGRPVGDFMRTMQAPIEAVAQDSDLCIAFGEPTSGTIAFFDAGSHVVHVSEQDWPTDYVITTPLKGTLMPSMRCAEALADLEHLFTDPAAWGQRHQAQAAAYAARRRGAHDTLFPDPLPLAGA